MGLFSSVVHSITHAADQVAGVVSDASRPVSGLFNSNNALLRLALNPADPVALGQTFNNTIKGQTPKEQLSNNNAEAKSAVHYVGYSHQELWYHIQDGVSWAYHAVIDLWHGIWYNIRNIWRQTGFRNHFDRLGTNIKIVVQKWGGERRVVAWAMVVVVVVLYVIWLIVTWGTGATLSGGWYALIVAILSYGVQQGMTPDAPKNVARSAAYIGPVDNSVFNNNSISGSNSGSQSPAGLAGILQGLKDMPPLILAGAAAISALAVFSLLKR